MDPRKTIETKTWHAAVATPLLRVFGQCVDKTPGIGSDQLDGTVGDGVAVASSLRVEL